jgi:hypothetical protein
VIAIGLRRLPYLKLNLSDIAQTGNTPHIDTLKYRAMGMDSCTTISQQILWCEGFGVLH